MHVPALLSPPPPRLLCLQQLAINVDAADLVHEDSNAEGALVAQEVGDQGGLPAT